MPNLKLAEKVLGKEAAKLIAEQRCPNCGRIALEHTYSDAGVREVKLSGLCEECFDEIFADVEEE